MGKHGKTLDNIERHGNIYEAMVIHGKTLEDMESHGMTREGMGAHGKTWKNKGHRRDCRAK